MNVKLRARDRNPQSKHCQASKTLVRFGLNAITVMISASSFSRGSNVCSHHQRSARLLLSSSDATSSRIIPTSYKSFYVRLVGPWRIPPAVTKRSHWNGWVSDAEPYISVPRSCPSLAEALFIQSYCSWSNLRSLSGYS